MKGLKYWLLTLIAIIVFAFSVAAQQSKGYCPTAGKEGIKIINKKYFKYFSLLLQDTCSGFNSSTNDFFHYKVGQTTFDNKFCPYVLLDSMMVIKIERWCKYTDSLQQNVKYIVKDISDKTMRKRVRNSYRAVNKYKYIRLYMGYKDNENNLCVIIQYLTKNNMINILFIKDILI